MAVRPLVLLLAAERSIHFQLLLPFFPQMEGRAVGSRAALTCPLTAMFG